MHPAANDSAGPLGVKYYVSPSGRDANAGTAPDAAWQTIDRLNEQRLRPGDQALFEGGKTFAGDITLDSASAGAPGKPVVISSYGEGRATIIPGADGNGLWAKGVHHLRVSKLNFVGPGRTTLNGARGVLLEDVEDAESSRSATSGARRSGWIR